MSDFTPANYYLVALLAGFFLGAMPWGLWIGLLVRRVDVRTLGSGNMGATNVFRSIGPFWGVLALLLDAFKGYAAAALIPGLLPGGESYPYIRLLGGLAAVAGHVFSPFAGFRGGKGVATSAGVFVGLAPLATAFAFGVFMLFVALSGFVSLGSLLASIALPLAIYLTRHTMPGQRWVPVLALSLVLSAVIWLRHRANMRRLLSGTESSFWKKADGGSAADKHASSAGQPAGRGDEGRPGAPR